MTALIRWSIDHRYGVLALALLVCVAGGLLARTVDVDVFPDLDRPGLTLMTHVPGLSPEETEKTLTDPIEQAFAGMPGLSAVWSTSSFGLSHVHAVFDWNADMAVVRTLVAQRVAALAGRLPQGAAPVILPFVSVMGEVDLVGLSGGGASPALLRTLADRELRPKLLAIPGVAQVLVIGGDVLEIGVEVDPAKLLAAHLGLADVRRAVAEVGGLGIGGVLPKDNQEYFIRLLGEARGMDDVRSAVVGRRPDGTPWRVSDLATVAPQAILKRGVAGIDAGPGVILSVYKAPGEDTRRISRDVGRALDAARASLPPAVQVTRIFRQSAFIDAAIGNVLSALREGGALVVLVLLLFLASLRTTAVTLTALPVSLLVTVVTLHLFGVSLNTLTLGGLAVAVGELVDDAIVDVENVWRRLGENRRSPSPKPSSQVVLDASVEVRGSILYATVVVVLAVVPLALLSGVEGRLFRPLVVAYVVSVAASLFVSVTLTPALCRLFLGGAPARARESGFVRWLKTLDERLLRRALANPIALLAGAGLLCAAAAASLPLLGRELLPPFSEGTLTVNVLAVPGITLPDSDRLGGLAERLLLEVPEVAGTGRRTGRAELDTHSAGINYSEIEVALRPGRPRAEIEADVRRRLQALPGVVVYIGQPISHRLEHVLEGMNGQIILRLFGPDLGRLRALADEAKGAMEKVPGLVDLQVEQQLLVPELRVQVDRERAAARGLNAGEVTRLAQEALFGAVAGRVPLDGHETDVRVQLDEESRSDSEAIARLPIPSPAGATPLGDVAQVVDAAGQDYIGHDDGERFISVTANAAGRDVSQVARDAQRAVAGRLGEAAASGPSDRLRAGERLTWGGVWREERQAARDIGLFSLLAVGLICLALLWHFRSLALTLQTLVNIPLSLVGSAGALWLSHEKLSVASAVGFVTVCGIASRNTILLLSHYLHLVEREGERFSVAMIVRGSLERLPPMLMTALTAGLAMVPLLLERHAPGKELLGPMAIVIAGGLVSSTLLDLAVTPAAFWLFGGKAARGRERSVTSGPGVSAFRPAANG
ncbi:MAG: efflux RND transporter permease subunit [Deltaproteobacteria bacterium]